MLVRFILRPVVYLRRKTLFTYEEFAELVFIIMPLVLIFGAIVGTVLYYLIFIN
jgi:hypothetical protein